MGFWDDINFAVTPIGVELLEIGFSIDHHTVTQWLPQTESDQSRVRQPLASDKGPALGTQRAVVRASLVASLLEKMIMNNADFMIKILSKKWKNEKIIIFAHWKYIEDYVYKM